jgi:hypothetical protein
MTRIIRPKQMPVNRVGRHYKPFPPNWPIKTQQFQQARSSESDEFSEIVPESLKSG